MNKLLKIVILCAALIVVGIGIPAAELLGGGLFNLEADLDSDMKVQASLKSQSLKVVSNIAGEMHDSVKIIRDECVNHPSGLANIRTCYYGAEYSFSGLSNSRLRELAKIDGWVQDARGVGYREYLTNMKYSYCHSLLRISDNLLAVHCYKIK